MFGNIVRNAVRSKIERTVQERASAVEAEDSFFVFDPEALEKQFELWKTHLPGITPYYAFKCNHHREIVAKLKELGTNFDCASEFEIKEVLESHGVSPSRVVYANPVKANSHLRYAAKAGVKRMTFDNLAELHKIKEHAPDSELLLRIKTDDSDAVCSLSCKFGAAMQQTELLLSEAQKLDLKVVGVAYHIGSGGTTAGEAHTEALKDARALFNIAQKFGMNFTVLDIGGGFGADAERFIAVSKVIRESLKSLQFDAKNLEMLAEPGRFFAEPAMVLVANVIGLRAAPNSDEVDMAYLSDGVYGNLNSVVYDQQEAHPFLVGDWDLESRREERASLWGPTCDGLDCVSKTAYFPRRLRVGDWIYFRDAGAYTLVGESQFNGFNHRTRVY